MQKRLPILIVILVTLTSACQTTSENKSTGSGNSKSVDITSAHIGQTYSWGGEILEIMNHESTTEITVIGYPLDEHARPEYESTSTGRFIAVYTGFLEPTDYRKGRLISITGILTEIRNGKVSEADYNFPVLAVDTLKLQKKRSKGFHLPFSIGIGIGI